MKRLIYLLCIIPALLCAQNRLKDKPTVGTPAGDDWIYVDGNTNGVRKLAPSYFAPAGSVVTPAGTQTLTNKTISGASNTITLAANAVGAAELQSTAVTPGSYTLSNLTIDGDGRVTVAANGALPIMAALPVYWDPVGGNDTNSGRVYNAAVRTSAKVKTLLAPGSTLYCKRDGIFYMGADGNLESNNFGAYPDLKVRGYGNGLRPIFTCSKPITGTWTNMGGSYPNVWKITVTHDFLTESNAYQNFWVTSGGANAVGVAQAVDPSFYCHFALWDDVSTSFLPGRDVGLTRFTDNGGADVALAVHLVLVNANAGSFTVRINDTDAGAQAIRAGSFENRSPFTVNATKFDYFVHFKDGVNPNTLTPGTRTQLDRTIRYNEQNNTFTAGYGADLEELNFYRSGSKDHLGSGSAALIGGRVHDIRIVDANVHGSVLRCAEYTKYYALRNINTDCAQAGEGLHLYRQQDFDGFARGVHIDDIETDGFVTGIFAHGEGPVGPTTPNGDKNLYSMWQIGNITVRNGWRGIAVIMCDTDVRINKLHLYNIKNLGLTNNANDDTQRFYPGSREITVTVDDFIFTHYALTDQIANGESKNRQIEVGSTAAVIAAVNAGTTVGMLYNGGTNILTGKIKILNGWSYLPFKDSSTARGLTSGMTYSATLVELYNYTAIGGGLGGNNLKLKAYNSIFDGCALPIGTTIVADQFVMDNCYVSADAYGRTPISKLRTLWPGIAANCITPIYYQPYERTVLVGDLLKTTARDSAAYPTYRTYEVLSAGAATFAADAGLEQHPSLILKGAGVAGVDIILQRPTDTGPDATKPWLRAYSSSNVSTFPVAIAGDVITYYWDKPVLFNATTANLCTDTTKVIVPDHLPYTVGQIIRVGTYGLYKITALTTTTLGATLVLDRPIDWLKFFGWQSLYKATAGTGNILGPTVTVSINFPILDIASGVVSNDSEIGVTGSVRLAGEGSDIFNFNSSGSTLGETGKLNITIIAPGDAAAHNSWYAFRNQVGYLDFFNGKIDWKIALFPGDSYKLKATVHVADWLPQYVGNPAHDHFPLLKAGSELLKRNMGWRYNAAR